MDNSNIRPQLDSPLQVAAFYCFTPLDEDVVAHLSSQLMKEAIQGQVKGTVLLATEGFNGTICGPKEGVTSLINSIQEILSGQIFEVKISWTYTQAFRRFRARRKSEIVTMGVPDVNPIDVVGIYVDPVDWNNYLCDPDTLVIDTRNEYEIAIGSFKDALNPHIDNFREFPKWVDTELHQIVEEKHPKQIAMFCTGGIRCEKATSYLLREGFKEVHHLQGGILKYLEQIPLRESRWDGECFVFDKRVALNHELSPGSYRLCHACGMPLAPEDLKATSYIPGVQCLHCKDRYSSKDKARFAERQKQIDNHNRSKDLIENSPTSINSIQ